MNSTSNVNQLAKAKSFFRLNYMLIFRDLYDSDRIEELSSQAAHNILENKTEFDKRVSGLTSKQVVEGEGQSNKGKFSPRLQWDSNVIRALQEKHNGLLVALFHFGKHRDVLVDLTLLGLKAVAPISGNAYQDYFKIQECAPDKYSDCLQLLRVESKNTSRKLISALRGGRIGIIYVDGNMGADATNYTDGTVTVPFMGSEINVKSSIARLGQSLQLPVLPIFARSDAIVKIGQPIAAASKGSMLDGVMFRLYQQFEEEVKHCPPDWEYALHFHHWLAQAEGKNQSDEASEAERFSLITVEADTVFFRNSQRVATIQESNKMVWIDTNTKKGYQPPNWWSSLFQILDQKVSASRLLNQIPQNVGIDEVDQILNQLVTKKLLLMRPLVA